MYLVKNLKVPSQPPRINLNDYIDKFSFIPFLHPDRRPEFQDRVKEYIPNVADIAAAIVTKLFIQRPNDKLILEAMSCCESILHSRGYETLIEKDLRKEAALIGDTSELAIAVLGCQTRDLLHSRVDAAISLISLLHTDIKVFFSGSAPGRSARIPNESKAMLNYYQAQARQLISSEIRDVTSAHPVYLESTSQSTHQNLKNILDKLQQNISKDTAHLFVVSSNFHLARIDWEISLLSEHKMYKKIDKIVLCGSEDLYRLSGVSKNGRYIKQLFFSVFNDLMHKDAFYNLPSED